MIMPLLAAGVTAYLAAWLTLWGRHRKAGMICLAIGWLLSASLMIVNGLVAGEPPLGNMYHVIVLLSFCLPPLYVVLAWREKLSWTAVYFAFLSALPLIGAIFMNRDMHWQRMPALQSPWFIPHVFAYMLSYALAAVAFVLLVVRWKNGWLKHPIDTGAYAQAAHQILRLAFPFMTFGMLSGALWAEKAWGAYWSWDSKETWSLITWTIYLIYFHSRRSPETEKYADLAHAMAFGALLITFFLVNFLPKLASVLHSYT